LSTHIVRAFYAPSSDEFSQFAKKKDGGTSTDGVSRAAFNKICLEFFVRIFTPLISPESLFSLPNFVA
jgi:hypothetical protein